MKVKVLRISPPIHYIGAVNEKVEGEAISFWAEISELNSGVPLPEHMVTKWQYYLKRPFSEQVSESFNHLLFTQPGDWLEIGETQIATRVSLCGLGREIDYLRNLSFSGEKM